MSATDGNPTLWIENEKYAVDASELRKFDGWDGLPLVITVLAAEHDRGGARKVVVTPGLRIEFYEPSPNVGFQAPADRRPRPRVEP